MPRSIALLAGLGALSLVATPRAARDTQATSPPSFVVFLTDDMGYTDVGAYGNPVIRTPNIDRMAREGIRLTSFYASAPSCTPSRAGFLTGRYAVRAGLPVPIGPGAPDGLRDSEVTLPEVLKTRGYRTALYGKWHLGDRPEFNPIHHGFDYFVGLPYSNDYRPPFVQNTPPVPLLNNTEVIEQPVDQDTLTLRYTDYAVAFLEHVGTDPFFLYISYAMPHLPISTPESFRGRSPAGRYGDVIEELDWSVGEIQRTLEDLDLDHNTLQVFMSDNGPWIDAPDRMWQEGMTVQDVGTAGALRESKASTYEGGMRVPGIVRWPAGIPAGQVSAGMASNMDFLPTFARLAGATLPDGLELDGNDISALLTGQGPSGTRELFYFAGRALQAVRQDQWKLRVTAPAGRGRAPAEPLVELYDMDVDPYERYNLAGTNPDVVGRLRVRLEAFRAETQPPQGAIGVND